MTISARKAVAAALVVVGAVAGVGVSSEASTLDVAITASGDDVEERSSTGAIFTSQAALDLVVDNGNRQSVGLRFRNVAVPPGATITSAYVQFESRVATTAAANLVLSAEASDNASPFTAQPFAVSSRPRTAVSVPWAAPPWPTAGERGPAQRTPDLASVLQAVVGRPGWQSGNALAVIVSGNGRRVAGSFDAGAAPVLHLELGDIPSNSAPVVDAGPDQAVELPNGAALAGTASDDGLPNPPAALDTVWSQVSGPGVVTFGDATATATSASFSQAGTYVLRLTADDSTLQQSDELQVTVTDGSPGTYVVEVPVRTGADDVEERLNTGSIVALNEVLDIVTENGARQLVGLRFAGVPLAQGATIVKAHVQFQARSASSGVAQILVEGEAADDASPFTTAPYAVSSRPRASTSVPWAVPTWTAGAERGVAQRTADLAPLIQEIVDRPGWSPGNALALVLSGAGKRMAEAVDGRSAPVLHLEIAGAAPTTQCADGIDNDGDGRIDMAEDPGCASPGDDDESNGPVAVCSDRLDNDGDGYTDFPADPSCTVADDDDEASPVAGSALVAAAGDIACKPGDTFFDGSDPAHCQHRATALIADRADAVVLLGDNQYGGTLNRHLRAYDLSWGQFAQKTFPTPGNTEYNDPGAAGYFSYWALKGRPTGGSPGGYYSWNIGNWHFISLNSNEGPCVAVPCGEGSAQNDWLEADLAAVPADRCVAAYWHYPLFNSGARHGDKDSSGVSPLWEDLYAARADLILNGHDHAYQRYAGLTPGGQVSADGIREFVSGGGGEGLNGLLDQKDPGFEFGLQAFGVLMLTLDAGSYSWQFIDINGDVLDSGGPVACH